MKKSLLLLTASLLFLSSVSPVLAFGPSPYHDANSSTTWIIAVSGSGVLKPPFPPYSTAPNSLNFKVNGWCVFTETSSSSVGYCSLTRNISSASGGYSCEGNFYITAWHAAQSFTGPVTDFIMDSGTVAVSPASTTSTCAQLLTVAGGYHVTPTGTPGLLTITAPSDSHFPITPGHYTTGAGPVTWSDFNLLVLEIPVR